MKKKKKPYKPETLTEIHFWIPKETMAKIKEISKMLNTTISQLCRKAIIEYLSKKEGESLEKQVNQG